MVSPATNPPPNEGPPTSGDAAVYTLDGCERAGDAFARDDKPAAAAEEFKRALLLLGNDRGPRRAGLYLKLGEATRAQGKTRVALNNLSKALALDPQNLRAYDLSLELLRGERDFAGIDELQLKRISLLDSAADKLAVWRENVELWLAEAGDRQRGVAALERLLELEPKEVAALKRLAAVQRDLGQHQKAIAALIALANALSGGEAARALKQAADLAFGELKDKGAAVALLERALQLDSSYEEALALAEQLLTAASEWDRLCGLCEQVATAAGDGQRKLRLWTQAAALAGEKLSDMPRAERALARALEIDDDDGELLRAMAEVRLEQGAYDRAIVSCREAIEVEGRAAVNFQLAYEVFQRSENTDGSFNAAAVLDYLGEADINQSVLADAHRPEGLLSPRGVLGEDEWQSKLLFSEREDDVQAALDLLAKSGVEAKLELLRRSKKSFAIDPSELQDLQASTATLVRALQWTTRVLGIEAPALYLRAELSAQIMAAPVAEPSIVACRSLGSGLDLKQLAFLWGRALTAVRPEHALAAHYPTEDELRLLLEAAALAARGKAASAGQEQKALALELEKAIDPALRKQLSAALNSMGEPADSAADWLVSYELSCCRAGLLACGDVAAAAELSERFPFGSATTPSEQIDELLAYSVSEEYAELRKRLGVNVAG